MQSGQCPLWVISGPFATTLRMSAIGGKADINHGHEKSPKIAINGPDDTGAVGFVS